MPTERFTRGGHAARSPHLPRRQGSVNFKDGRAWRTPGARPLPLPRSEAERQGCTSDLSSHRALPGSTTSDSRAHFPQSALHQNPRQMPSVPRTSDRSRVALKRSRCSENGHWRRSPQRAAGDLRGLLSFLPLRAGPEPPPSQEARVAQRVLRPNQAQRLHLLPRRTQRPGRRVTEHWEEEEPGQRWETPARLGAAPVCGSTAPEDALGPEISRELPGAPGCPPSWEPHTPDTIRQGVDVRPTEPRKTGPAGEGKSSDPNRQKRKVGARAWQTTHRFPGGQREI